ncbi:polysaccharide biosynthesis/export family protein [Tsuneonella sp. HG094]
MFFRLLAVLIAASQLSACASRGPVGPLQGASGPTSSIQVVNSGELPAPTVGDFTGDTLPYRIGAYDVLDIGVFGIEGMERREVRVDGAGRVAFPLVGTVDALGITPAELETRLADRLRANYVRDPRVSVNLKEQVSQTFTVAGQVREPGNFPLIGKMTLVRAVARAKGLDEFAKTDEVLVFRQVNGQKMAGLFDIRGIERGNYDDPAIYPNDVIIVGDSAQRRLIRDIIGIAPTLLAPLIVTLANNN